MTRFDRYLLRTITATSLIALAFLLAVDYIVQISVDADDLGQGSYTLAVLLLQLLLVLPQKLLLYAPAAILVGTIMGLGQLSAQNEIAVVRAAGISRLRLARAGIAFALIVGVLNIVNGETIAPQLADRSRLLRSQALGEPADTGPAQGIWLKQQNTIIHIGALNADGSLVRLRSYQSDAGHITIREADRATWDAPDWQLENPRGWRTSADKTESTAAPARWRDPAGAARARRHQQRRNPARTLHPDPLHGGERPQPRTRKPQTVATAADPAHHRRHGIAGATLCLWQ